MTFRVTPLEPFGILVEPILLLQDINSVDVCQLRHLVENNLLIVLRGFQAFKDSESFSDFCERWGEISLWPYGKILDLVEHESPQDHIFDNGCVPLHWDGMYRPQVPEFQIFHCLEAPLQGQGGRTTFSHTTRVLESIPPSVKELWARASGIYERKMEHYHGRVSSPLIVKHPYRNVSVIRYNEPPPDSEEKFLNPPEMKFTGVDDGELKVLHRTLKETLYGAENFYAHQWRSGDVVISDNFSLLHGREKFVSKSPRHLQRIHVLSRVPFRNPGLEEFQ